MITSELLEARISDLLDVFYSKRIEKLDLIKIRDPLKRKNPYLYRAIGTGDVAEIIEGLLKAHVSSSDETLFGNEFFEPLATWVAKETAKARGGSAQSSDGEGVDISIEYDHYIEAIAVKSGVNVFNASSKKKQGENFDSLRKRMNKLQKRFDPVVGYCYGKKAQTSKSNINFAEYAGRKFWHHISGDEEFYLKIISLMQTKPEVHAPLFMQAFERSKNRLAMEFSKDFCKEDGSIDWNKFVEFNSG
jgi:hypothetical protein